MSGNILELMGATAGALALIDRMVENPKARRRNPGMILHEGDVFVHWIDPTTRRLLSKQVTVVPQGIKLARSKLAAGALDPHVVEFKGGVANVVWDKDDAMENPRGRPERTLAVRDRSSALRYFESLLQSGVDWSDAQFKVSQRFNVSPARIAADYDLRYAKNPRGRSKRPVTRKSQASGKSPTKRLVARRVKTARAPKGLYANPKAPRTWAVIDKKSKRMIGQATTQKGAVDIAKRNYAPGSYVIRNIQTPSRDNQWTRTYATGVGRNPIRGGYEVEAGGAKIAQFRTLAHAKEYGHAFADRYKVQVKLRKE